MKLSGWLPRVLVKDWLMILGGIECVQQIEVEKLLYVRCMQCVEVNPGPRPDRLVKECGIK